MGKPSVYSYPDYVSFLVSGGPTSFWGVLGCNLVFVTPTVHYECHACHIVSVFQGFMNEVFWEFFCFFIFYIGGLGLSLSQNTLLPYTCGLPSCLFSLLIPIVVRSVKLYTQISCEDSKEFVCLFFVFLLFTAWESKVSIFSISSCVFSAEEERLSALAI